MDFFTTQERSQEFAKVEQKGDESFLAGSRGKSPCGGLGWRPQKL